MNILDQTIDSIQEGKKQFVKNWITNPQAAEALNSYVDVQTQFVKQVVKSTNSINTVIADEVIKAAKEVGKVDYAKIGEGFAKVYLDSQSIFAQNPWFMNSPVASAPKESKAK